MNSLLNEADDDDVDLHRGSRDREITLGTTLILGIFFGLAVLCAVFFGFGYSLGSKHSALTAANPSLEPNGPALASSGAKPRPGSPVDSPGSSANGGTAGSAARSSPAEAPGVAFNQPPPPKPAAPARTAAPDEPVAAPGRSSVKTTPPAAAAPDPAAAGASTTSAGQSMVQVAAVSHQEDADLLASTLRRRGYAVTIHPEADKLLHVQIGPFPTKKEADAMRQRLLADGFNAYVK